MIWRATSSERPPGRGGAPALVLALALAALLPACGRKADPLPPVVRVAARIDDLTVSQREADAVLRFTLPTLTTAGGPLPDLESVELWRAVLPAAMEPKDTSSRARATRVQLLTARGGVRVLLDAAEIAEREHGGVVELTDPLEDVSAADGGVVWYGVRTRCCRRRLSEMSNIVRLVPGQPPAPPQGFAVKARSDGILLSWTPVEGLSVEVDRSPDGRDWTVATASPVDGGEWLDQGAPQGTSWYYRARSVESRPTEGNVIGPPSPVVEVPNPDVWPPQPATDLVCLPEGTRVLLRWQPSPDAVGYRVERQLEDGPWQEVATGLTELAYVDASPPPGRLTYAVRALDAAGNAAEPATCTTLATGARP